MLAPTSYTVEHVYAQDEKTKTKTFDNVFDDALNSDILQGQDPLTNISEEMAWVWRIIRCSWAIGMIWYINITISLVWLTEFSELDIPDAMKTNLRVLSSFSIICLTCMFCGFIHHSVQKDERNEYTPVDTQPPNYPQRPYVGSRVDGVENPKRKSKPNPNPNSKSPRKHGEPKHGGVP